MRHPYPKTAFDRPQWKLAPDQAGLRMYGPVSNRLDVVQNGRVLYKVALAVPSELFTYLHQVAKAPVDSSVTLSIDFYEGWYVFSALVEVGEDATLHDLWAYPARGLPEWVCAPEFQVR